MDRDDNALDAQEVADILQISRNTVYNLVKSGVLTSYNVGRKMRFTMSDVESYIERAHAAQSGKPTAGTAGAVRGAAHAVPDARRRAPRPAFCIAGNDIAADVVSNYLGGAGMPMRRVYENSYRALADMYRGEVEAALVHLYDHRTDSYNVPYVQRLVPGTPVVVIRVVARRQGFLVARGNPKGLRRWVDLLRADVTMVNREKGAGTRILLDEQLVALEAGVKRPAGYDRELTSPLALGAFIANGGADVGVGSERVFHQVDGLDFLPLQDEYLDLVLLKQERTAEVIGFIRRVLSSAGFRDELGSIVGYDTDDTGKVLYEV